MSRLRALLDEALFGPESAARLAVTHAALTGAIAVRIALTPVTRFADLPPALVSPVPPLGFLDGMPSASVIVAVQVVGVLCAIAALARRRPRLTYAIAWLCYLFLAGVRASRGKVLHNDLLLLWISAVFLLAPLPACRRDRTPSRLYGWPVRTAIAMTAIVYWFAAYEKIRRSGPMWALGDNMSWVMRWATVVGEPNAPRLAQWLGDHAIVAKATAAATLATELLFPLVLFFRRLRPVFALAAVALHVGTWLVLGLDYWMWAVTVLIVLIDWPQLSDLVRRRIGRRTPAVGDSAGVRGLQDGMAMIDGRSGV